jgi:hypothetical protein
MIVFLISQNAQKEFCICKPLNFNVFEVLKFLEVSLKRKKTNARTKLLTVNKTGDRQIAFCFEKDFSV